MCGAGAGFGSPPRIDSRKARWQSGHAAACKAVYAGSIPTLASRILFCDVPRRSTTSQKPRKTLQFQPFRVPSCPLTG